MHQPTNLKMSPNSNSQAATETSPFERLDSPGGWSASTGAETIHCICCFSFAWREYGARRTSHTSHHTTIPLRQQREMIFRYDKCDAVEVRCLEFNTECDQHFLSVNVCAVAVDNNTRDFLEITKSNYSCAVHLHISSSPQDGGGKEISSPPPLIFFREGVESPCGSPNAVWLSNQKGPE